MDFFMSYLPQIFIVVGLLLILLELVVGIETGLDMVLIGSVLLISGFVGMLLGNIPLMLVLAITLSVLYIAVGRRQIRHRLTVATSRTNIDRLIGSNATVIRQISPEKAGMVRMDDETWRATADEIIYESDVVTVESVEGVTLRVRKLAK